MGCFDLVQIKSVLTSFNLNKNVVFFCLVDFCLYSHVMGFYVGAVNISFSA